MPIYIIRHAECQANLDDKLVGAFESPLTPCGQAQVGHLRRHLANVAFSHIYSSPLQRARQTAIALKGPLTILPELIELNAGDWENQSLTDLASQETYNTFFTYVDDGVAPNGDSIADLRKRLKSLKDYLFNSVDPAENIAIVSHGILLMVLISELLNKPMKELPMLCNASVSIFNLKDGKFEVDQWRNDMYIPTEHRQSKRRIRTNEPPQAWGGKPMDIEELCSLISSCTTPPIITSRNLICKENRTLVHGKTLDDWFWHVYLEDCQIHTLKYRPHRPPVPIEVRQNQDYVPFPLPSPYNSCNEKLVVLYLEACDYEFFSLLLKRGVYLPEQRLLRHVKKEGTYWGNTLPNQRRGNHAFNMQPSNQPRSE